MAEGYGADTYCYDAPITGRLVSGPELVAQAIYRRLTTPRGTLDDGDEGDVYGLDLQDFVGQFSTADGIAALPDQVRGEVLKDDRVSECTVEVDAVTDSSGLTSYAIDVACTLHDAGDDFELTLSLSATDGVALVKAAVNGSTVAEAA
jgi:hypothetical protein